MVNKKIVNFKDNKVKIDVERVRRITGYITGDVKGWNDGKKAELKDRVKHTKREDLFLSFLLYFNKK